MGIVTNPNLYTGNPSVEVIEPLVMQNVTMDAEVVRFHNDVNGKKILLKQDVEYTIENYADDFIPQGNIVQNFSDVVLEPVPMTVNMEIGKSGFFQSFLADRVPGGIGVNNSVTPEAVRAAINYLGKRISSDVEQIVWGGKTFENSYNVTGGPTGAINQLALTAGSRSPGSTVLAATAINSTGSPSVTTLTMASTTGIDVNSIITIVTSAGSPTVNGESIVGMSFRVRAKTATTLTLVNFYTNQPVTVVGGGTLAITFTTINQTNVLDNFAIVLQGLSQKVKNAVKDRGSEMVWVMSTNVADAYNLALMQKSNAQVNYLNLTPMSDFVQKAYASNIVPVYGYSALMIPGMPPNTIALYAKDTINVGLDSRESSSNLNIIDLSGTQNKNMISVRADWAMDVKLLYADQASVIAPLAV